MLAEIARSAHHQRRVVANEKNAFGVKVAVRHLAGTATRYNVSGHCAWFDMPARSPGFEKVTRQADQHPAGIAFARLARNDKASDRPLRLRNFAEFFHNGVHRRDEVASERGHHDDLGSSSRPPQLEQLRNGRAGRATVDSRQTSDKRSARTLKRPKFSRHLTPRSYTSPSILDRLAHTGLGPVRRPHQCA